MTSEVTRLRNLAQAALTLADAAITVHEQVNMDTPEDRELHDRATTTFRQQSALIHRLLDY